MKRNRHEAPRKGEENQLTPVVLCQIPRKVFSLVCSRFQVTQGLFTWSGGPRSSGVCFFCFHALGNTKQKKPTPLNRGPALHVKRVLVGKANQKELRQNLLGAGERQSSEPVRACLHGGGGPQIGEVTCGGSPHLSCKRDESKMRDYMDRRAPHLSRLPHLTGVPHLHVNRPKD